MCVGVNLCVCVSVRCRREKKKRNNSGKRNVYRLVLLISFHFISFLFCLVFLLFFFYGKFVKFHNTCKMTSYNGSNGGSCKLFMAANQKRKENTQRSREKKNESKWQS